MIKNPQVEPTDLPTGWKAQTYERRQTLTIVTPVTGRLHHSAIWLTAGTVVSNILFQSSTTALSGGSHGWASLHNGSRVLLGQSVNDTGITWATNTLKTFALAAPVTISSTGWHYLGLCVVATTMPTLVGVAPNNAGLTGQLAPVVGGYSTASGLTTTAPDPAPALTTSFLAYGGVS